MTLKLYYVHDPMCAWCYAFRPALKTLLDTLPDNIDIVRLVGGLARDSDDPMPEETRQYVIANWQRIEKVVPGTEFNYDFWIKCKPRRSTYPACRAVISARLQGDEFDKAMTHAIQNAYYLQSRNPSDQSTLIELAQELSLDVDRFTHDLNSTETEVTLQNEIRQSRRLGLNSFPSILLENKVKQIRVEPDYLDTEKMLKIINTNL